MRRRVGAAGGGARARRATLHCKVSSSARCGSSSRAARSASAALVITWRSCRAWRRPRRAWRRCASSWAWCGSCSTSAQAALSPEETSARVCAAACLRGRASLAPPPLLSGYFDVRGVGGSAPTAPSAPAASGAAEPMAPPRMLTSFNQSAPPLLSLRRRRSLRAGGIRATSATSRAWPPLALHRMPPPSPAAGGARTLPYPLRRAGQGNPTCSSAPCWVCARLAAPAPPVRRRRRPRLRPGPSQEPPPCSVCSAVARRRRRLRQLGGRRLRRPPVVARAGRSLGHARSPSASAVLRRPGRPSRERATGGKTALPSAHAQSPCPRRRRRVALELLPAACVSAAEQGESRWWIGALAALGVCAVVLGIVLVAVTISRAPRRAQPPTRPMPPTRPIARRRQPTLARATPLPGAPPPPCRTASCSTTTSASVRCSRRFTAAAAKSRPSCARCSTSKRPSPRKRCNRAVSVRSAPR